VFAGQVLQVFFDQVLGDRPVAAPEVEAADVAQVRLLGQPGAERAGAGQQALQHRGEIRDQVPEESVAVLLQEDLNTVVFLGDIFLNGSHVDCACLVVFNQPQNNFWRKSAKPVRYIANVTKYIFCYV